MKRVGVVVGSPESMPEKKIVPYEEALRVVGLEPVRIRPGSPIPDFDGLMLTGGTDLSPALYNQPRGEYTQTPDPPREEMECVLLDAALASGCGTPVDSPRAPVAKSGRRSGLEQFERPVRKRPGRIPSKSVNPRVQPEATPSQAPGPMTG